MIENATANENIKFNKTGDTDFNMMIAKSSEEMYKKISEENNQLKECFRQLQRELFDIVDIKADIYMKRFRAEYGEQKELDNEETIKSEIQKIRDEVFNVPFEDSCKEIVSKF